MPHLRDERISPLLKVADRLNAFLLQKAPASNPKTAVVAFFIAPKTYGCHNFMFIKDKPMWHITCLILRNTKWRLRMQVASLFDLLHERPAGIASRVVKNVDIPGLGPVCVVSSVDCLGAMCPRPQLLAMKVLGEVESGEIVEVVLDNPAAVEGFPALAQTISCTHLATVRESGCWRVYLRKSL
jgi:tRNA 2-thiouridine synthesizing protein A